MYNIAIGHIDLLKYLILLNTEKIREVFDFFHWTYLVSGLVLIPDIDVMAQLSPQAAEKRSFLLLQCHLPCTPGRLGQSQIYRAGG